MGDVSCYAYCCVIVQVAVADALGPIGSFATVVKTVVCAWRCSDTCFQHRTFVHVGMRVRMAVEIGETQNMHRGRGSTGRVAMHSGGEDLPDPQS